MTRICILLDQEISVCSALLKRFRSKDDFFLRLVTVE